LPVLAIERADVNCYVRWLTSRKLAATTTSKALLKAVENARWRRACRHPEASRFSTLFLNKPFQASILIPSLLRRPPMPENPLSTAMKVIPKVVEHMRTTDESVFANGALPKKVKLRMAMAFDAADGAVGSGASGFSGA
jgi:hypothetical protein